MVHWLGPCASAARAQVGPWSGNRSLMPCGLAKKKKKKSKWWEFSLLQNYVWVKHHPHIILQNSELEYVTFWVKSSDLGLNRSSCLQELFQRWLSCGGELFLQKFNMCYLIFTHNINFHTYSFGIRCFYSAKQGNITLGFLYDLKLNFLTSSACHSTHTHTHTHIHKHTQTESIY